jgi:hypothetical protein
MNILQVDFPMPGPLDARTEKDFEGLAQSINDEPGFLWKIWTWKTDPHEGGGIYAFENEEAAQNYLDMHSKRLRGILGDDLEIRARSFSVSEHLSGINNAGQMIIK